MSGHSVEMDPKTTLPQGKERVEVAEVHIVVR